MTRFRVHLEDGEIVPIDADTPAEAAAQVRKARKGAIVRKVKRDKSNKPSNRHAVVGHIIGKISTMTELESLMARGAITEYVIPASTLEIKYVECDYSKEDLLRVKMEKLDWVEVKEISIAHYSEQQNSINTVSIDDVNKLVKDWRD